MNEKLYTFTVPVVIYATKRVDIVAESEDEAREMLLGTDWYDSQDDHYDEECDWDAATLDEVQEMDDE
jgi:hypothetical protein